jgi:hypothetical protein
MKTVGKQLAVGLGLILVAAVLTVTANAQCGSQSGAVLRHQSWQPGGGQYQSGSFLLASETSATDPIVGMWHVTFTAEGNTAGPPDGTPIDNAIVHWHSDGTEIMNSGRPAQDGNFCLGVWEKVGTSSYLLNHFALGNDTENAPSGIGNPAGPTRILEKIFLSADGNSYTGTFSLTAHSTSGTQVARIVGAISATRITVSSTVNQLYE